MKPQVLGWLLLLKRQGFVYINNEGVGLEGPEGSRKLSKNVHLIADLIKEKQRKSDV